MDIISGGYSQCGDLIQSLLEKVLELGEEGTALATIRSFEAGCTSKGRLVGRLR